MGVGERGWPFIIPLAFGLVPLNSTLPIIPWVQLCRMFAYGYLVGSSDFDFLGISGLSIGRQQQPCRLGRRDLGFGVGNCFGLALARRIKSKSMDARIYECSLAER